MRPWLPGRMAFAYFLVTHLAGIVRTTG
jgi:hypothetical protein